MRNSAARNRGERKYRVDDNQIQDLNDTDGTQNEDDYNDDCRVSVDFSNAANEGSVGELELDVNDTSPVSCPIFPQRRNPQPVSLWK